MSEDLLEFKKDIMSANSSLSVGYINIVMVYCNFIVILNIVILFATFCFLFYFNGFAKILFYIFVSFSYKWKVMFNPNKAGFFEDSFSCGGGVSLAPLHISWRTYLISI